jgi:ABC-type glycerol-3-phosphate transport system substrate-binding protein
VRRAVIGIALGLIGCHDEPARPPPIRFLHTFGAEETELFNATMRERGLAVESQLVPFARGQQVINDILRARTDCPDLIRLDATWLPALVVANLLAEVPAPLAARDWSPEAAALGQLRGQWWALPQSVDGLVVLRERETPAPASPQLGDLLAAARAARSEALRYPLGVRVDGYWFVPWLRNDGGDLAPDGIAGDAAVRAMQALAALFGDVAPPPPPPGSEDDEESRRWNAREVAYWITGPWALGKLRDQAPIAVSPLADAPRGGQLLVVPRCARHPDDGWRLAGELTSLPVEARFAAAFAAVPTRMAALAGAPELLRMAYDALRSASMLPREPITPLLFDDLNPALAAVVAGDATPEEAIAGVRRGWQRLLAKAAP